MGERKMKCKPDSCGRRALGSNVSRKAVKRGIRETRLRKLSKGLASLTTARVMGLGSDVMALTFSCSCSQKNTYLYRTYVVGRTQTCSTNVLRLRECAPSHLLTQLNGTSVIICPGSLANSLLLPKSSHRARHYIPLLTSSRYSDPDACNLDTQLPLGIQHPSSPAISKYYRSVQGPASDRYAWHVGLAWRFAWLACLARLRAEDKKPKLTSCEGTTTPCG
ncbi:hypothetical protein IQ07DRAFT_140021 [Pyrenochaeta sp. DS3sAY3a]|nr:hypothetical protein IQ07DRAFT_140021 [Pyrenochaeta sp. DS3sAY3a]